MQVAAHQHRAATGRARGVDRRAAKQAHAVAQHLHRAAGLACAAARRCDGAGDDRVAARRTQRDEAVLHAHRVGSDDAGLVDDGGERPTERVGCEPHIAAVGTDAARVANHSTHGAGVHREFDQAIARHIQQHVRAGGQANGSTWRSDAADVGYVGSGKDHIAAIGRIDLPFVDHGTLCDAGRSAQRYQPRHEVGVGHRERGGQYGARVNHGRGREVNPV